MSPFDELAGQVFTSISNLMGVDAVWHSSTGQTVTGRVLFKNPTEPMQIGDSEGFEYRPNTTTAEYHADVFPGLKEAVDNQSAEFVNIETRCYLVIDVTTKFDGRTCIAHLELHED